MCKSHACKILFKQKYYKQNILIASKVEVLIIVEHVEVEPWLIYICLIRGLKAPPSLSSTVNICIAHFFPRDISTTSAIAPAIDTPSSGPDMPHIFQRFTL